MYQFISRKKNLLLSCCTLFLLLTLFITPQIKAETLFEESELEEFLQQLVFYLRNINYSASCWKKSRMCLENRLYSKRRARNKGAQFVCFFFGKSLDSKYYLY